MISRKIFVFIACMLGSLQASQDFYIKGVDTSDVSKNIVESAYYSILTLNACMMDGDLPTLYGGMTPASERVDRLARFILREDPDIFLGQEIMSGAGQKLYEQLKNQYSHFWIGIGKIPGKEESGLFVASKRPFQRKPQFVPFLDQNQVDKKYFPNQTRFIERGFFLLDMGSFFVVTTHLEGGGEQCGALRHRINQLHLLTETMDLKEKPYIVAGDLNLMRTGWLDDEYSLAKIADDYFDYYTLHHPAVHNETYTCTNYFTAVANNYPIPTAEEKNEIDDYFLIRKPYQDQFMDLNVVLIGGTYDISQPRENALTDHKAYKATFQFHRFLRS
jgi:exonuclease III